MRTITTLTKLHKQLKYKCELMSNKQPWRYYIRLEIKHDRCSEGNVYVVRLLFLILCSNEMRLLHLFQTTKYFYPVIRKVRLSVSKFQTFKHDTTRHDKIRQGPVLKPSSTVRHISSIGTDDWSFYATNNTVDSLLCSYLHHTLLYA